MNLLLSGSHSAETSSLMNSVASRLSHSDLDLEICGLFFSEAPGVSTAMEEYSFSAQVFSLNESLEQEYSEFAIETLARLVSTEFWSNLRFDALKLLNRKDVTGTFRLLEREVFLQSSFLSILDLFSELRPSLVVFSVSPHLFLPYVAFRVAEALGIETLHLQPCPGAPIAIPRLTNGATLEETSQGKSGSQLPEAIVELFSESLTVLEASQDPSYMVEQKNRDKRATTFSSKLRAIFWSVGWLFKERFPNSISFSGHPKPHSFFQRGLGLLLQRSLQRELKSRVDMLPSPSLNGAYCLFAMHYEPERTSFPEGLPIRSQMDAVAIARKMTPPELRLLVKEHYSQKTTALRGFLGRSPLFYDLVGNFPRTQVISADERLTGLVPNARCVFTLTGSIAIEAALAGVPVAYFGTPWWEGMPGTVKIGPDSDFGTITCRADSSTKEIKHFLVSRVRELGIFSFGGNPNTGIEHRFRESSLELLELESQALADAITRALKRPQFAGDPVQ